MAGASFHVLITSPERVLVDSRAHSALFPGERGEFEVLPLHRPLVSRLVAGMVVVDGQGLAIRRGVVRVADDEVIAVIELRAGASS